MEQQPHNPVPIELENQFLIRLPPEPAAALREAVRSGASNLKERLFIKLEPDRQDNPCLRKGNVKFDGWTMRSKLVDLPTIIESHKTIDKKTLYKTADICQLLICKEGESSEEELGSEPEIEKKDPNKVEKKFVYPHGITPPLKNCRKRRFRKTLKKKHCLDEPEIEKEVKRLFRNDNEAVNVKWQLMTEDEYNASKGTMAGGANADRSDTNLGEQDLFGDLSDIEHDHEPDHDRSDSKIEPSEGESTMFGEPGPSSAAGQPTQPLVTEFNRDMFKASGVQDAVAVKSAKINGEINELKKKKAEMERNIANCPNPVLIVKLRENLSSVENEIRAREMEVDAFSMFT